MSMKRVHNLDNLIGATIKKINDRNSRIIDVVTDKGTMAFDHDQCCCENVYLYDGLEELQAMVGEEILFAEEVSNVYTGDYEPYDSYTWTFYKISTQWKEATLRFIGESNGYYSEDIDLYWEGL